MNRQDLERLSKTELIDIILSLVNRVAELEVRLNMNSLNSSKPPSSDGFKRPQSNRKPSGKKSGGQPGHKGSGLKMTKEPDEYMYHEPKCCSDCSGYDSCKAKEFHGQPHYEIDIEVKPVITAHFQVSRICPKVSNLISGRLPIGINSTMQYGANLKALAVSLNTQGMVSINRTHEILSGVFGVPISCGSIAKMIRDAASAVSPTVNEIKELLIQQDVVHFDETGIRINGESFWNHVASTNKLTLHTITKGRGFDAMNEAGILSNYKGTGVHDCLSSYFKYDNMRHGLCNAHLLRELEGITQNYNQPWANIMSDFLLNLKSKKEKSLDLGITKANPLDKLISLYIYEYITHMALEANPMQPKDPNEPRKKGRQKRGKAGALADRLKRRQVEYLLFYLDFTVPFDNNQAERDLRMFKVKQKVSGCFRTKQGADDFASISSFISTARKCGLSAFESIRDALNGRAFRLRVVSLTE
jgi:transposase